jgi:hypothetical protein
MTGILERSIRRAEKLRDQALRNQEFGKAAVWERVARRRSASHPDLITVRFDVSTPEVMANETAAAPSAPEGAPDDPQIEEEPEASINATDSTIHPE